MWYIGLTGCEKGVMMMTTKNTHNEKLVFTRATLTNIKQETKKLFEVLSLVKGELLGISEEDMKKFLSGVAFLKEDAQTLQFSLNKLRKEAREVKAGAHRAPLMKVRKHK